MSDIEEEMEATQEKAKALGVGGDSSGDSQDSAEDGISPDSEKSDTTEQTAETSQTSEASKASETSEASETLGATNPDNKPQISGLDSHGYPNPDKNVGSLTDTYENFNVYVPPEVKKEVNAFYKELEYEYSTEHGHGEALDKHWDFYTALFRAILENREIVREELGLRDPRSD